MTILFLGYTDSLLIDFLIEEGNIVIPWNQQISTELIQEKEIEYIISYGYRYIIKKDILELLPDRVVNLHISYLPFNKGADPNFWSFVEDTPKGVTIHMVDESLDTGEVLVREQLDFSHKNTLRETYDFLQARIQELFRLNWDAIKNGTQARIIQTGEGSYHRSKDKGSFLVGIEDKWLDIPITNLIQHYNLIKNHPSSLVLRNVRFNDWELLLSWRNDAITRNNSFTSELLPADDHKNWLLETLQNPNRRLYIAMDDGQAVGTVRADLSPDEKLCEISWTVAPEHRGKGIGKSMVKKLADLTGGKQIAKIKQGNIGSVKIAEFAGMHLTQESDGALVYRNY